MENITTPLSIKTPPEGRGVMQYPSRGGPPIQGRVLIFQKTPPPIVDLYVYVILFHSTKIVIIYQINKFRGIKKGINFFEPFIKYPIIILSLLSDGSFVILFIDTTLLPSKFVLSSDDEFFPSQLSLFLFRVGGEKERTTQTPISNNYVFNYKYFF